MKLTWDQFDSRLVTFSLSIFPNGQKIENLLNIEMILRVI